jgi:soluble lytic murein transglycosylase-like protein
MTTNIAAVQAALDKARRLGTVIEPPLIPKEQGTSRSSSAPHAAGTSHASFEHLIREAAAREGVDAGLVRAVAQAESNFNPNAVSSAGAKGIMQLMDGTARSLGVTNSFDPAQNIAGGARYLKQMLTRYGGDVRHALAAYNAGPRAVDQHRGIPPYAETQTYVQRVLALRSRG